MVGGVGQWAVGSSGSAGPVRWPVRLNLVSNERSLHPPLALPGASLGEEVNRFTLDGGLRNQLSAYELRPRRFSTVSFARIRHTK